MAQRRIVNQTMDRFTELAMLSWNYLHHQEEFKKFKWLEDEQKMNEYKKRLENWFKENTEKIS